MLSASLDWNLFTDVNGLTGDGFADGFFKLVATDLPTVLMVAIALVFLLPWPGRRLQRRSGAVLATAAAGLALLANQPISHLVERTRPYLAHPGHAHLLIARSADASFPSDHATGAFALAFGVWLYDRTLGACLLVVAALISFARVYVGTHYPGDVIAGALIGIGVAALLYAIPPVRRMIEAVARRSGDLLDSLPLWRRGAPQLS
jgi:undecaprenyl-diphosphatase